MGVLPFLERPRADFMSGQGRMASDVETTHCSSLNIGKELFQKDGSSAFLLVACMSSSRIGWDVPGRVHVDKSPL